MATIKPRRLPAVVTVTGPESTGKSTLAAELARWYGAELSREASRAYAEARQGALPPGTPPDALLGPDDVEPIARAQIVEEDAAVERARCSGALLVVRDTDLVSTVVYARHYYGACPAWIVDAARERRPDLYVLCALDVPWAADGVRDRPHAREALWRAFAEATSGPHPIAPAMGMLARGDVARRLASAREMVDVLVAGANEVAANDAAADRTRAGGR